MTSKSGAEIPREETGRSAGAGGELVAGPAALLRSRKPVGTGFARKSRAEGPSGLGGDAPGGSPRRRLRDVLGARDGLFLIAPHGSHRGRGQGTPGGVAHQSQGRVPGRE